MSYRIVFSEALKEKLTVLKKKDRATFQQTQKKIMQIAELTPEGVRLNRKLSSATRYSDEL